MNISRITAATWEKINRIFVRIAAQNGIEAGRVTRTDSTVMDANIHEPTDNSFLWDSVRTMNRHILKGQNDLGCSLVLHDHSRASRKLSYEIEKQGSKSSKGKNAYKKLLKIIGKTMGYLVSGLISICPTTNPDLSAWLEKGWELTSLVDRVIDQTKRRVLQGEKVPACEKILSIFEPHADIIVKGGRKVQYGHKLNVTTGASGLIIDMMVEKGNLTDSTTVLPALERQVEIYGCPPRQTAYDGGYASKNNLRMVKELGGKDVMFHKRKGLKVAAITGSRWVFKKLRDFRGGVEGNISTLKRKYGWYICTWKGWEKF